MLTDSISAHLEKPRTARYTGHVEAVLVVTLMIVTSNIIKEVCTTFLLILSAAVQFKVS